MPKMPVLSWSVHKSNWQNCTNCYLSETRSKVILGKGKLPCDVLFVGEAPGFSEDTIGVPFIGNAGRLLHEMIDEAEFYTQEVRKAFTNLLGCIPIEDKKKVHEPPADCVKSCAHRLQEFVELSKPKALVMIGRHAQEWCPKLLDYDFEVSTDVMHPAGILRLDESQKHLAIQRCVVKLKDVFNRVGD